MRYGIYDRSQNVVDVFFDWASEGLLDSERMKWAALRQGSQKFPVSSATAQIRPAIVFDELPTGDAENPRIEYLREDDPMYAYHFASLMVAQVSAPEFGRSLIRDALKAEQIKLGDPDAMGAMYDQLFEGLWIVDFTFAKRWCLICHSSPEFLKDRSDGLELTEIVFHRMWKTVRARLDDLKENAESLNEWWYGLYCCRPYLYMTEYLAGSTRNRRLGQKIRRFVDEVETDYSMTLDRGYSTYFQNAPQAVAELILDIRSIAEIGATIRYFDGRLEHVKTDAPSGALDDAIKGMEFELAARYRWPKAVYREASAFLRENKRVHLGDKPPRICMDINPTLVAAVQALLAGNLSG
jgi:hypothetical protein